MDAGRIRASQILISPVKLLPRTWAWTPKMSFRKSRDSPIRLSKYIEDADPAKYRINKTFSTENNVRRWERLSSSCGDSEHLYSEISVTSFDKKHSASVKEMQQHSLFIKTLITNGLSPFVNFSPLGTDYVHAGIGYPSGDIQDDERILLERWFDYVGAG
ncbi:hypothetical protein BMR07_07395 [Methylococcaceae bacterium CS1]|nr:hypothetical protein BMR10_07890 [Methylococcaceae bacterium CS4]TXK97100.1 hypothetical protein BMR11_10735 [Methylococcaceae bacterium CS5]TXL06023.1 hypothetical protein BMR09_08925 [Methylococcaceae bacterium CS3]TXL06351.1 hypothetical protein BMR07_07395 [Methylococcaceae bacterium CS1]TXL11630.1 hypothetical protein BMR08_03610 [Methylococcaceae bacterium CS2]